MRFSTHFSCPAKRPLSGGVRRAMFRNLQVACQVKNASLWRGFTLVEMLAVIVVIAVLASSVAYSVSKAKALARQADCKSSMRQLGAAILVYRSDPVNKGRNPPWLSSLYPDYVDDLHLFVCRSDPARGTGRTRASDLTPEDASTQKFPETVDNMSNPSRLSAGSSCCLAANGTVSACSYFYEFSSAYCDQSWSRPGMDADGNGRISWWEYKEYQLVHGDEASTNQPYSSSRMPMIRCYHHYKEGSIYGHPQDPSSKRVSTTIQSFAITINVAYAGNVYVGPLWWEGALKPGEM